VALRFSDRLRFLRAVSPYPTVKGMSRAEEKERVGLCAECVHGRRVVSAKGSEFWLCAKSETDPRFPKYPRLPVLQCNGYARSESPHPASPQRGEEKR